MKKIYEAPQLLVDEYVADTMIASATPEEQSSQLFEEYFQDEYNTWGAKNDNPDNNQNCWGCDQESMQPSGKNNLCMGFKYYDANDNLIGIC